MPNVNPAPADPATGRHHLVRRALFVLALVVLTVYALIQAQAILLPLAFAGLFAMLFSPVVDWLADRMKRGIAIAIVTVGLLALLVGILMLAGNQIASFSSDLPAIQDKAAQLIEDAQSWASTQLNIEESRIEERVDRQLDEAPRKIATQAQSWAGTLTGFLGDVFLFFVYLILLLSMRDRLRNFVLKLSPNDRRETTKHTMDEVRKVAGQYLWGRLILIAVLFGIYIGGFTIAGLSYGLVIAAIAAALSIIPYFGNIVAAGLVLVVAAFSDDVQSTLLITLGTMAFAQVIESYVLEPLVVGDKVDLNPITTVIAVVAFTSIWGVAGSILALPIVGILRQVLAVMPRGEPWAYLLSNGDGDS